MQQTMMLDERLWPRTRADHHAHRPGEHVTLVGTCELVVWASAGDQGAWDQLVERYGEVVWTVARGHGLGLEDSAKVSQVTWLLLTQHLGSLPRPDRLGEWLVATATREALRMRRLRGAEGH